MKLEYVDQDGRTWKWNDPVAPWNKSFCAFCDRNEWIQTEWRCHMEDCEGSVNARGKVHVPRLIRVADIGPGGTWQGTCKCGWRRDLAQSHTAAGRSAIRHLRAEAPRAARA